MPSVMKSTIILLSCSSMVFGATRPGQCSDSSPCTTGTCVSIKTDIANLEKASQCTIDPLCSGNSAGACPTFSAWPKIYRGIESVCAFVEPGNCAQTVNQTATDTVDCFTHTVTNGNISSNVLGIYSCVDSSIYIANNGSNIDDEATAAQLESCAGEESLCNGQGTCSPVSAFSSEYACVCNSGFTADDNCLEPINNDCNSAGQCGEGGECNVISRTCECAPGIAGFQCSECTTDESCGGSDRGTCGADKKCVCATGSSGQFCGSAVAVGAAPSTFTGVSVAVGIVAMVVPLLM